MLGLVAGVGSTATGPEPVGFDPVAAALIGHPRGLDTEVGRPGGVKARHVFMCGLGPSGAPTCARIPIAAGGPFHGESSLLYKLTVTCDGTLSIAGWEGVRRSSWFTAARPWLIP